MKMIFKWLKHKLGTLDDKNTMGDSPVSTSDFPNYGLRINVRAATGGKIIEYTKRDKPHGNGVNKYDDQVRTEAYIISDEENFIESFSKITSMELMR
jgi:hypothetical protein